MKKIQIVDDRRELIVPGDKILTIQYAVNHFIDCAQDAIKTQGYFSVALSGGSTPKEIYKLLSRAPFKELIDWSRVLLFWSDERNVPPSYPESNYNMAMSAGIRHVGLPVNNIFRMQADVEIEKNALKYEELIKKKIPKKRFDLVMLGMGDDGHTASLFPDTEALEATGQLAVASWIPKKANWRMTLTYDCINDADQVAVYVIGEKKAPMVKQALVGDYDPARFPVQKIGTPKQKALWILDEEAASMLPSRRHS